MKALVGALGGNDLVSSAGGDIMAALVAGESRISERLDAIERQLEEVLDQRFIVELATVSRFVLDAIASPDHAAQGLERARQHLMQAAAEALGPAG